MPHLYRFVISAILVLSVTEFMAQQKVDSEKSTVDSTITVKKKSQHSPLKAAIFSGIVPGLGQVYNRKYWKVPILAAAGAGLMYSYSFNQSNYTTFKSELIYRQKNQAISNLDLERYSDSDLNELQDFYRRYRDLTIIGMALLYAVNIVDATVDAHLYDFNVSDDLSLRFFDVPTLSARNGMSQPLSLGLTLNF
jgi:hypothetical protein